MRASAKSAGLLGAALTLLAAVPAVAEAPRLVKQGTAMQLQVQGKPMLLIAGELGPSFSKILLNGSQIQVASDGGTNGGSSNREVDLDFFPSALFTRLDLAKTPVPSTVEGGIAGTVNLRNARPFDKPGTHIMAVAQGQYTDSNERVSPRGAIVASHIFGIPASLHRKSQR